MLVLSRRPNQEILFPNSGIRIRLLGLRGGVARVGIEAPPDVPVFRAELAPEGLEVRRDLPTGEAMHRLRNQLNKVTLGLYRFEQQWQTGSRVQAEATFQQVLAALEDLDRDWPADRGQQPAQPPAHRNRCRALLIEDDANERELLAGILQMNGCECATVEDGQDALEYLSSHERPDLVLLDMGLPRVSGPQTLGQIRSEPRWRGMKVFAVSGTPPADLGITVGDAGVDAWFTKPINPRRLWDAIQKGLMSNHGTN